MKPLTKLSPFHEEESDWPLLTRWNPFREMERMQTRMHGLFGRGDGGREEAITTTEWEPLVDISEDDKGYVITAELPELKKEDVKVSVENGVLTLSGERKFEHEEKHKSIIGSNAHTQLHTKLQPAERRRCREDQRRVQGWRSEGPSAEERKREAEGH